MTINIQEVFTWPAKSTQLKVTEGQVELDSGASFSAALLTSEGVQTVACGRVYLTPEQYAAWGDDDVEVAHMVATNLGLVPA